MPQGLERLRSNLTQIHQRMRAACERSGRTFEDVQLVAVTKYAPWDAIRALVSLGQTVLAENRPQQLVERADRLRHEDPEAAPSVVWHLIGTLQRNKVRLVLPTAAVIHSVDSLRLLERIAWLGNELSLTPRVLLEVNVSNEVSKQGFSESELLQQWEAIEKVSGVDVCGLMTMAPWSDDPEEARPVFRRLRELRDRLERNGTRFQLSELSMGMSGDFEPAIEEGATCIRIGSLLFEGWEGTDDGEPTT